MFEIAHVCCHSRGGNLIETFFSIQILGGKIELFYFSSRLDVFTQIENYCGNLIVHFYNYFLRTGRQTIGGRCVTVPITWQYYRPH